MVNNFYDRASNTILEEAVKTPIKKMTGLNAVQEQQLREKLSKFWSTVTASTESHERKSRYEMFDRLGDQAAGCTIKVNPESTALLSELSKELRIFMKSNFNVKTIQQFSRIFLEEYNKLFTAPEQKWVPLTGNDITRLANTATALYLENWLSSDATHRRNITAFSQYQFGKPTGAGWGHNSVNYASKDAQQYRKAYHRYLEIARENQAQLKRENQPPIELPTKTTNLPGQPVELDYVTLASLSVWNSQDAFRITDRFFRERFFIPNDQIYDKEKHTVKYQHNHWLNGKLHGDLQNLYHFINDLKKQYPKANSEELLTDYVTGCMAVYKMERSIHFDQLSRSVLSDMKGPKAMDDGNLFYWAACTSRIPGFTGYLVGGKNGPDKLDEGYWHSDYTLIGEPIDVLNHQDQIDFCAEHNGIDAITEGVRVLLQRGLLSDLLIMLHGTFPPHAMRPWQRDDFRAAADFFAKDFNILEKFLEAKAPKLKSKDDPTHLYYDLLMQQIRILYREPGLPARQIVDSLKPPYKTKKSEPQ